MPSESAEKIGYVKRPLLLDLFCGAGGAGKGWHDAGFEVVGVDINPQPHYPFQIFRADWLVGLLELAPMASVVHASPPCQGYSRLRHLPWLKDNYYIKLIDAVRWALINVGLPWVIENVEDAPMPYSTVLCGQTFGLPLYRHRRFGSSHLIMSPPHERHRQVITAGHMLKGRGRVATWERTSRLPDVMGCPWMTQKEVAQAIPPAYTEWIGTQLMGVLRAA
jgi:DNA (cytosine-5)-methyltransferase 1